VSEFGKYTDAAQPINRWRYYARCLDCSREASREFGARDRGHRNARLTRWRKENPAAAFKVDERKRLRAKYGINVEQRDAMFAAQGGRCLICGEVKVLSVDHDHQTGRVRGGLCTRCNVALGRVEADRSRADRTPLGPAMLAYLSNVPDPIPYMPITEELDA